jgi:GR25 family glycosyltransferase involved in LPS biosynthesis
MIPPFLIPHYKGNAERRRYLETQFSQFALPKPIFITDFDSQDFSKRDFYTYDEAQFRRMIGPIKDFLIANVIGLFNLPNASWAYCYEVQKRRNLTLDQEFASHKWLEPLALTESAVSLFLKHRVAWAKIADGESEYAIIAEDDIIFFPHSVEYLTGLVARLPNDFDYIDLVGGCNLLPREGNKAINDFFFEIVPPQSRTTCCALLSRSFACRLLSLDLPICLPIDWSLTFAFNVTGAQVYWLHPPVFGHGSEMNIYKSSIERDSRTMSHRQRPIRRNELCPCGSGKKFKHCHGAFEN